VTEKHAYDFDLRLTDPVSTHALQFRMISEGARVLDIGCHTGILGEALRKQKHCHVIGIDNDRDALGVAKSRLDSALEIDIEIPGWTRTLLEVGKSNFDVVLFGDVIEHTRDPLSILGETKVLIAPHGVAIVSLPNVANLRIRLGLLFGRFTYQDSGILDRTHLRFFTLQSARKMLKDAGYQPIEERYSGYSLPRWLIDLFPTFFAVNIIIAAKVNDRESR